MREIIKKCEECRRAVLWVGRQTLQELTGGFMIYFARGCVLALCGMGVCLGVAMPASAFADASAKAEMGQPLLNNAALLESSFYESAKPPLILSTELPFLPYFHTVVATANAPMDEISQKLMHQVQTSINASFIESSLDERHMLNLAWDLSWMDTSKCGKIELNPVMSFADEAQWGEEPPLIWAEVWIVAPNSPTLDHFNIDSSDRRVKFLWAGIDAETLASMKVRFSKDDEPSIPLEGEGGPLDSLTAEGLALSLDSLEAGASYTLDLDVGSAVWWQAKITYYGGTEVALSVFGGNRDGGDSLGDGPSAGEQPSVPEEGDSSTPGSDEESNMGAAGPLESYGPTEVTIGGKRANDLAARQDLVVFDFSNEVVSIPSSTLEALGLEGSDTLTVKPSSSATGSLTSLNGNPIDLQATTSPTQQNVRSANVRQISVVALVVASLLSLAVGLFYAAYQLIRRQDAQS